MGLGDYWLTTVMIIEVSRDCCAIMPANGTRCRRLAGAEKGSPGHLRALSVRRRRTPARGTRRLPLRDVRVAAGAVIDSFLGLAQSVTATMAFDTRIPG
jgi:hypothetical protein